MPRVYTVYEALGSPGHEDIYAHDHSQFLFILSFDSCHQFQFEVRLVFVCFCFVLRNVRKSYSLPQYVCYNLNSVFLRFVDISR